jgi:hypothetical protein
VFVTQKLMSLLVYTSPYYPQGNAVNEASHKAIGASLVAMADAPDASTFPSALRDATMVYNSVPHVHTGQSPNYLIFGMELALPGWQKYQREQSDKDIRKVTFETERLHQCARAQFARERAENAAANVSVAPGDWVVYHLSAYEKGTLETGNLNEKSKAGWSLPAKILSVKDKVCELLPWGARATGRQVPLALVRKLEGTLPAVLAAANVGLLEKVQPRTIRHWALDPEVKEPSVTWTDVISKAVPDVTGEPAPEKSRKRRRPVQ